MKNSACEDKKRILIVAGEASGDAHAAELITTVLARYPQYSFFGIGGQAMRQAGAHILIDAADMAVVGGIEILTHLHKIISAYQRIHHILKHNPPDLLILVDYPGFNLRLAKLAKKYQVKVLYYISPQVWGWRQGRIKVIKQCVDKMAVIFPFEVDFYRRFEVPAYYVGNPLAHTAKPTLDYPTALHTFGLPSKSSAEFSSESSAEISCATDLLNNFYSDTSNTSNTSRSIPTTPATPILGILPGSRQSEINYLLPIMLGAAKKLKQHFPNLQLILPLASTIQESQITPYIQQFNLNITIIRNKIYDVLQVCNAVVAASGTVTLEATMMLTPTVLVYKFSPLTFMVAKRLCKVKYLSMTNIIADKPVIKELIQKDATSENIYQAVMKIFVDQDYRNNMRREMQAVKQHLTSPAEHSIFDLVATLVTGHSNLANT